MEITLSIKRNERNDAINYFDRATGCLVATLFDGTDKIIFDELAYGPALLDDSIPANFIESEFSRMGIGPYELRYVAGAGVAE